VSPLFYFEEDVGGVGFYEQAFGDIAANDG
jgi:hypothetical protein